MLALRKIEPGVGGLSVDEVPVPEPGPGEVKIKVAYTGICGTDLHIYNWVPFAQRMQLPTVLGHETSGTIVAVGEGVSSVKVDDFISMESHISCGTCYTCHMGQANVCMNTRYPGVDIDGGFAPYVVVPEKIVWKQPEGISPQVAAMFEPFGIAVHASFKGRGMAGMNVLVAGCGPIGLMNIIVAKALGANRVIATDVSPTRLQQARDLAPDAVIDVSNGNQQAIKTIRDMTRRNGVDVSLEYSGAPQSLALISEVTVAGGELVMVGVPGGETLVNLETWLLKGFDIYNVHGRRLHSTWEQASKLVLDKKVDLEQLISHVMPISEAPRGVDLLLKGEGIKILIEPEDA
ncbi:MAG TPA: L-threonine 3-dehydrogenase [Gammaproteobacteria bacterium]|jgi:threonine 3-dehydrogenase|nr:L-threonine 3-dehydrogenase [Gammaproteobacteria bacterium]